MVLLQNQRTTFFFLSLPLAIALIIVSAIGYTTPDLYHQETLNWQIQSRGQDIIDLFLIAPILLLSTYMSIRSNKWWISIWAATIVYLIYSFLIFCFSVHFNFLFPVYCLILGLSFYSILYYIIILRKLTLPERFAASPITVAIGIYLIFISVMFYGLWLSEILPFVIKGETPTSLIETGLQTNPVHVIDLSVILPGVFITGVMLLKKNYLGLQLAAILLIFFIIMNITIASLHIMLREQGLVTSISIAWGMIALAILSLFFFILLVRKYPIYGYETNIK